MVQKWNIDKNKCSDIAKVHISNIIQENSNNIEFYELISILNKRTKILDLKNNNEKKTMTNFLKLNFKGTLNFIKQYDIFFVTKKSNKIFISYNNKENLFSEYDDWIFINQENIES